MELELPVCDGVADPCVPVSDDEDDEVEEEEEDDEVEEPAGGSAGCAPGETGSVAAPPQPSVNNSIRAVAHSTP
ncbi:MAG TPA: hypothetical protein VLV47_00835 [Candidatus Bathyarchaeia archaeon]|nr:hypothetical protein [Candidatus Bathyarchaeia archaeon]